MKTAIIALLNQGKSYNHIQQTIGCSKATISYHAKRIQHGTDSKFVKRYNWEEVQKFFNKCLDRTETIKHFGMNKTSWNKAINTGRLVYPPNWKRKNKRDVEEYLVDNRIQTSRAALKRRLLSEGLLEYRCYNSECIITDSWLGNPLSLHLDHINGKKNDNRIENLRFLCPNCHSQTETYAGRNARRCEPV